ncbi:MAG: histidine phosphatase family protein [Paracoccaceae bacterium]
MSDYPEIFVLRHGQTEWNLAGRYQGRLNSPLTEQGRAQAREQSEILTLLLQGRRDLSACCSPQDRAVDTAAIALSGVGLTAQSDDRLCEIAFGKWQGLTFDEISKDWPELCKIADQDRFAWNFQAPGGETFQDVSVRVKSFLDSLTGPTVIVTHGVTSKVLRGLWLGVGQDEMHGLGGGQGCVYHLNDGVQKRYPAI